MKCNNCGKREANIKYSENINGKKQELNLCYECAEKLGVIDFSDSFAPMFTSMFSGLPEMFEETKCDKCGYTLDDYKKTGLFGCDHCYETFDDSIDNLLLKIHGKNRHIQRIDHRRKDHNETDEIEILQEKLEKLVKEEKYEEAAIVRDQIKKIKGK
ncbi:MAG: UvrB/UvrC motif-containing protein [Clostridia bacterium]|nr:UvrB/UvrC motif-containing protein [Clostridia bacterium]